MRWPSFFAATGLPASDVEEVHHAHAEGLVVEFLVREQVFERVDSKERGNRDKAMVFAEIAPNEQAMVKAVEVLFGRVVLLHDFFEFAILQAKIVHLVDELRVLEVVLIGVDKVVDLVELPDLAIFLEDKGKRQYTDKNHSNR